MVKINVMFDKIAQRFDGWTMHVFFLGDRMAPYKTVALTKSKLEYSVVLDVLAGSRPLYGVGVDLFQPIKNYAGEPCKVHIGWANRWCNGPNVVDVTNAAVATEGPIGKVDIEFNPPKGATLADPPDVNAINEVTEALVKQSMSLFVKRHQSSSPRLLPHQLIKATEDGELAPIVPFVRRVHAPKYCGARLTTLPGWAYYVMQPLRSSEAWLLEWIRVACRRRSLREVDIVAAVSRQFVRSDDVVEEAFTRVCALLIEVCTAPVTAYPYVSDFYLASGKHVNWESFDPFFIRKCGDCEDATKATCRVMRTLATFEFKSAVGRALSRVAQLYAPTAVLGVVSQQAYRSTCESIQNPQAHMFSLFVPLQRFAAWSKTKLSLYDGAISPWMSNLECWVGEGTGRVLPFSHISSGPPTPIANVLSHLCCTSDEELVPSHGKNDSFYHMMVHLFTDVVLAAGGVHAAFSFVAKSSRTSNRFGACESSHVYGMKIVDVLDKPSDVLLVPHPTGSPEAVRIVTNALKFNHPDRVLNEELPLTRIGARMTVPGNMPRGKRSVLFIDSFVKTLPSSEDLTSRLGRWSEVVNVTRVDIVSEPLTYRVRWWFE